MIAYASRTGNVRYIVSKLALPAVDIADIGTITEPFLLFTYTDALGGVPQAVKQFMDRNGRYCHGVVVSGNSNFGHANFGGAGDAIAREWQVPLVRKLESDLWEVRSHLSSGRIARVFFTVRAGKMALLHGFVKKSQKTPPQELELARRRKHQWLTG